MSIKHQWLKRPDVKNEIIIKMYQSGSSSEQIGNELGLAKSSVSRRLKKLGIQLRNSSSYSGKDRYWLWKGEKYLDPIIRRYNQRKLRKWSKAVRDRDGHKCTKCGSLKYLHAHHKVPIELCIDSEIEFDTSNGITLCAKCHKAIHKK